MKNRHFSDPGKILNEVIEFVEDCSDRAVDIPTFLNAIVNATECRGGNDLFKNIEKEIYSFAPFTRSRKPRIYLYSIDNIKFVFIYYDPKKKHEKIKGEFRKSLLKKGRDYFERFDEGQNYYLEALENLYKLNIGEDI